MDEKCATQICGSITKIEPAYVSQPAETRPMYLIVVNGGIPGAMLRLSSGMTRLGRSRDNGIHFPDLGISRRHASIVSDLHGDVWLTDQDSTNGTYLNGARLTSHLPQLLHDGDRVQLGSNVVLKFVRLDPCDEQFQRELFERSVRDTLTGLYNRGFFLDQIDSLASYSESRGLGLAILILDIDHFKRVNDSYGHDAGDSVLREVAAVLREATRSEDLVARYGGEEFILALPVAAPDQATERAERIRSSLRSRRIDFNSARNGASGSLRVTASFGLVYANPGRLRSPTALITAADHCLYQAKDGGRDRVVVRVDPYPNFDHVHEMVMPKTNDS